MEKTDDDNDEDEDKEQAEKGGYRRTSNPIQHIRKVMHFRCKRAINCTHYNALRPRRNRWRHLRAELFVTMAYYQLPTPPPPLSQPPSPQSTILMHLDDTHKVGRLQKGFRGLTTQKPFMCKVCRSRDVPGSNRLRQVQPRTELINTPTSMQT